jgi:cyanophycin synthetase
VILAAHGDELVAHDGGERITLAAASELPSTLGGVARFNVANALAAAAAAHGIGMRWDEIADGLRTFETGFAQNPGRFNVTSGPGFTTIVDYAHNPEAMRALGEAVTALRTPAGRTIGMVSTPGDRRDEDIREIGGIAAGIFDLLVFRELPDGRGREPGDVLALLEEGARAAGADDARIVIVPDEFAAASTALALARPDDIVALMPSDVDGIWRLVQQSAASENVDV